LSTSHPISKKKSSGDGRDAKPLLLLPDVSPPDET
jgi:hypothetical protein